MGDVCRNYRVQRLSVDTLELIIHLQEGYMGVSRNSRNGNKWKQTFKMKRNLGLFSGSQGLGFPQFRRTFLGVAIFSNYRLRGLCRGPRILRNYHMCLNATLREGYYRF